MKLPNNDARVSEKHRAFARLGEVDNHLQKLPPCKRIKARGRLVQNQQVGLVAQRQQNRHLL